jgi:hypothetical protein
MRPLVLSVFFLVKSKAPPLDILDTFFARLGHKHGGSVRTDQGGKLARSSALSDLLLRKFQYVMEPTGADNPSQNGAVEIYNDKLAVRTRTLLYGAGLPAKYWSAVLQHSVYLHNRLVHTITKKTPFKALYGHKPDICHLKLFGSRVCVKMAGIRRGKLDRHNFKGIFLGYTATDNNIVYLDLNSGVVKHCHHAQFDEAWYLQTTRPPTAQLLYDIGIAPDPASYSEAGVVTPPMVSDHHPVGSINKIKVPWPPIPPSDTAKPVPDMCTQLPLPLGHMASSISPGFPPARVAKASAPTPNTPRLARRPRAIDIMADFNISRNDMAMIYLSPDRYYDAFEQPLDLSKLDIANHATAGLSLLETGGRLHFATMSPSTPAAKMKDWRTRVKGVWLIKIGDVNVSTIKDAKLVFQALHNSGLTSTTLLFAHPEVRLNLSHDDLPIISSAPFSQATHDQLNNRWEFTTVANHLRSCRPTHSTVVSGGVHNVITKVMKLTRGKLLKGPDWDDWQSSEYLQPCLVPQS